MIHGVVCVLLYQVTCTESGCSTTMNMQPYTLPLGAGGQFNKPPGWHILDDRIICPKHEVMVARVNA